MTEQQLTAMKQALWAVKEARDCHPNDLNELIWQAEEALEDAIEQAEKSNIKQVIHLYDKPPAAPVQEPVACMVETEDGVMVWPISDYNEAGTYCEEGEFPIKLYTTPPAAQREWQGLTDEEVEYPHPPAKPPVYATAKNTKSVRDGYEMGGYEIEPGYYSEEQLDEFAKAIEAKLKEKNNVQEAQ